MTQAAFSNSQYALWPWPFLLEKGERVKLITPVDQGILTVRGTLMRDAERTNGWEEGDIRLFFDIHSPLSVRYKINAIGAVISLYESDQYIDGVLGLVSLTGAFTAHTGDERTQFGLHLDDVKANQQKSTVLSDAARADGANMPGEPRT